MYLSSCHFYSIPQGGLILFLFYLALGCKHMQMLMNGYFWRDSTAFLKDLIVSTMDDKNVYFFTFLLWLGDTCRQFLWVEQRVKRERETHSWCCGLILNELLCFHTEVPGKWPQWPSVWYLAFAFSHRLIFHFSNTKFSLYCAFSGSIGIAKNKRKQIYIQNSQT